MHYFAEESLEDPSSDSIDVKGVTIGGEVFRGAEMTQDQPIATKEVDVSESLQSEVNSGTQQAESNVVEAESQPHGEVSEQQEVEPQVKTAESLDHDTDQFVEASSDRPESPPEAGQEDEFHDAPDESEASSQLDTQTQQDSPQLAEVESQLKSLDIANNQDVNNVNTETVEPKTEDSNSEENLSESAAQPQKQIEQNVQVCFEREVKVVETQPKVENVEIQSVNSPSDSS